MAEDVEHLRSPIHHANRNRRVQHASRAGRVREGTPDSATIPAVTIIGVMNPDPASSANPPLAGSVLVDDLTSGSRIVGIPRPPGDDRAPATSSRLPRCLMDFNVRFQRRCCARSPETTIDGRCTKRFATSRNRDVLVVDCHVVCRIIAAPASTGQIDLRPGVHVTPLTTGAAVPIAADETRSDAHRPACVDKEHPDIATRAVPMLEGVRWRIRRTFFPN